MRRANENAIIWGLAVALCSGFLAIVYSILRRLVDSGMDDAMKTPGAEVLAGTASTLWGPTWALCIAGMILAVPGGFAVYGYFAATRVEPLARAGFLLSIIDAILWMPLVSFMGLTGPAAAKFPQAAPVLVATVFKGTGGLVMLLAVLVQIASYACTGSAMLKTAMLPKWMGVARLLAGVLFALPVVFPGAEIVAGTLATGVNARLLWAVRRGAFPEDRAALEAIAVART